MRFRFFKKSGQQQGKANKECTMLDVIGATSAALIADWLEPDEIVSLSCTSKGLNALFKELIHKAVTELSTIQSVLRLENIDNLHHLLFDNDMGNVLLKPRVRREIQALLNLCSAYKAYADAIESLLNSELKIWLFEYERIFDHIEDCQNAVSSWLLSNNVIDVLQAYSDVFLMIKEMAQSGKIHWNKLDKFLVSRLGVAQEKAGPVYMKMMLAALWTVVESLDDEADQRFTDRDHALGRLYYLYVFNGRAGGGLEKSGAGHRGGYKRLKDLPLANMNSHIALLTGVLKHLLMQEFIDNENITRKNRP